MRGGRVLVERQVGAYEQRRIKAGPCWQHFHRHSFLGACSDPFLWVAVASDLFTNFSLEDHASRFRTLFCRNHARVDSPSQQQATQPATSRNSVWLHCRCMARCGGSTDETGVDWGVAHRDFSDHGCGGISCPMESARPCIRNFIGSSRRKTRATFDYLGVARGLSLGGGKHTHDFRDPRHWSEHCLSICGIPTAFLGSFWGFLFFNELRQAGWRRWVGVLGGAVVMCVGAAILAIASAAQGVSTAHSFNGVWAALGAGVLWGTMYIPYRKAYLTGMNPLSFVTFFTFGELGMMGTLALS